MPGLSLVKKTKILIPRRRPDFLRRQRLIDFLHSRIDRRLLLVSAPAGYGKTTLLVDFANDTDLPVCWYSLDSGAQDPRTFLEHFIACIQQRFPEFGSRTVEMLDSLTDMTEAGLNPVLVSLVNEILDEIPEYFAIVLDDFHLVEQNSAITRFITRFLEDAPENCCLIVAGRTVPGRLPIVTLASKQQVAGLGSNDLRFTPDEIQALVRQVYDVELSAEDAHALAQDTEGWITGILLSTHRLWQGLLEGLIRARGTMTVYDYLANEVFNQQDPKVQEFLLGSSILDDMTPELCDAVLETNNSWAMLNLLEERNLFLNRLGADGQWYRYHRLFQGYLVSRLQREEPGRFAELHRRAAAYWEGKNDLPQAISHLLSAGDYPAAADRMERIASTMIASGRHMGLMQWYETLPADVSRQHPWLLVHCAKAYAQYGQPDMALSLLDTAENAFRQSLDTKGTVQVSVQRGTIFRLQGRYKEGAEQCARAAMLASQVDAPTVAELERCWGICLGQLGQLQAGVEHLQRALQLHLLSGSEFNAALARTDLAAFLERMGQLDEALAQLEKSAAVLQRARNPSELANTLNSMGVIYYFRGEYARARETLQHALQAAHDAGSGRWTAYILAGLGDIERDSGNAAEALDHYQKALALLDEKQEGFLTMYIHAAQAELHAALGEPLWAQDLARQARELAEAHRSSYEQGLAGIATGLARLPRDATQAVQELQRAADLLKENGAMRDMTRAVFLLAAALEQAGAHEKALTRLEEALTLATKLGYRTALRALAGWAKPLLTRAAQSGMDVADILQGAAPPAPASAEAGETPPAETHTIRLLGLGGSRVEMDGEAVLTKWSKARELIFLLATENEGRGVLRDDIYQALWPGDSEHKSYGNLYTLVYRVRRFLTNDCVQYEDNVYRFAPAGGYTCDVTEFQALIAKAQAAHDPAEALMWYEKAVALYKGDFLEDIATEWTLHQQTALRDLFLMAIARVANHYWQMGNHEMTIALTHRWLEEDPTDEAAHRLLMRCFAAQGNIGAVRRQYQLCERILAQELQVEPDEETRELYASLTAPGE
ncbi:MAG: BTAD domain-containing putative transcriptional regulator [Anaerolineales bacterium]